MGAKSTGALSRTLLSLLAILAITSLSLWLRSLTSPYPQPLDHDDELFARSALHILEGGWLGAYDARTTLAKGPGYPLFLAACASLGLSSFMLLHLLHLLAGGLLGAVGASLSRSRAAGICLYAALALEPSKWGIQTNRFIRDDLYAVITLLLLALLSLLLLERRPWERGPALLRALLLGLWWVALSATATLYWITREERPWLLPTLLLLLFLATRRTRRARRTAPGLLSQRRAVALATLVAVGAASLAAVGSVRERNEEVYGVALLSDLAEGEFPLMFAQWQAIEADTPRPYVPISRAQRQAAYAVSPTARKLSPAIEGEVGRTWQEASCQGGGPCDDLGGGWMPWAIRAAAQERGMAPDAPAAQRLYRDIRVEIATACGQGRLQCARPGAGLLPPLRSWRPTAFAHASLTGVQGLISQQHAARGGVISFPLTRAAWAPFARLDPGLAPTWEEQGAAQATDNEHVVVLFWAGDVISRFFPAVLLFALLGAGATLVRRIRAGTLHDPATAAVACLGLVALSAVGARLALLALVDSTSFPAMESTYSLPAAPLLVLALWCALVLFDLEERRLRDRTRTTRTVDPAPEHTPQPTTALPEAA